MIELKIKRERLATRCEICHKSDYYDSLNDNCLRCSKINSVSAILLTNHTNLTPLPNFLKNLLLENTLDLYVNLFIKIIFYFVLFLILYFLLLYLSLFINGVRVSLESIGLDASQTESFVGIISPFDMLFATVLLGVVMGLIKFGVSFEYSKGQ